MKSVSALNRAVEDGAFLVLAAQVLAGHFGFGQSTAHRMIAGSDRCKRDVAIAPRSCFFSNSSHKG
jgi:hypothetical protein